MPGEQYEVVFHLVLAIFYAGMALRIVPVVTVWWQWVAIAGLGLIVVLHLLSAGRHARRWKRGR